MVGMEVTTNAGEISVQYGQASTVIAGRMRKTMQLVEREIVRTLRASIRASIGRYSGRLLNRVRGRLRLDEGAYGIVLRVRSLQWYARGHELGATRTPTKGAHMTIPLMGAANDMRGGIVRWNDGTKKTAAFTAREVMAAPGRFGFSGTFTRNGIIFGRLLDHDEILPLFVLKRSVQLRARHMHSDARQVVEPRVAEMLGVAVGEALDAITAGQAGTRTASESSLPGLVSQLQSQLGA